MRMCMCMFMFTAMVMFSALSFHSFLAGLSLGADPEGTAVFIAIMAVPLAGGGFGCTKFRAP